MNIEPYTGCTGWRASLAPSASSLADAGIPPLFPPNSSLAETPIFSNKTKKPQPIRGQGFSLTVKLDFWWRRGESNPVPLSPSLALQGGCSGFAHLLCPN